jgi:hypothetical protein
MVILNYDLKKQKVFLVVLQCILLGVLLQVVRKHKSGRALRIIFFPLALILFVIGWGLTWIGTREQSPCKAHAKPQKENMHLEAIVLEEAPEIIN